ncbi:MAG: bifunctional DNA-formamidopyrimidine glycosylase/DNA-(apurinic or apyrimidinic site) lyase [Longimicrobiales bacterium]
MPELPEAETIARDLHTRAAGAIVRATRVHRPDILAPGTTASRLSAGLRGRRLVRVSRRGKNVVLEFDGDWRLVVNLGMTGRIVTSDSPRARELHHIAARILLEDGRALLYDDARRFGRLDLRDPGGWQTRSAQLGIEPLSTDFTADWLFNATRRSRVPLRNWLLDQARIAGVGNIYANEALFRAGVRPTRRTHLLRRREAGPLRDAIHEVLSEAIHSRGTTLNDYRDGTGERGGFQFQLRVYDREGEPCFRCGTAIKRIVLSNRSAFYCPNCQR